MVHDKLDSGLHALPVVRLVITVIRIKVLLVNHKFHDLVLVRIGNKDQRIAAALNAAKVHGRRDWDAYHVRERVKAYERHRREAYGTMTVDPHDFHCGPF